MAGNHPGAVKKAWGFTVCGGNAGYRYTQTVLTFFKDMVDLCENDCDDQRTLNMSYKDVADIQWRNVNETSQQVHYPDFSLGYHKVGSSGSTKKHVDALQVLVLGTKDITRGGTAEDCDDAWIIHPHSGKSARTSWQIYGIEMSNRGGLPNP